MKSTKARSAVNSAVLIGLLAFSTFVNAHGGGEEHGGMEGIEGMKGMEDTKLVDDSEYLPTYFGHGEYVGLLYSHISLMILAWVFILPIAVVLSLAKSRFTLLSQLAFLATNGLGVVFITIYNAETPDLYPNNAHHVIGWIITWVASAQVLVGLIGKAAGIVSGHRRSSSAESHAFIPVPQDSPGLDRQYFRDVANRRGSHDSGQGSERNTSSLRSNSLSSLHDDEEGLHMEADAMKEYEEGGNDLFEYLPLTQASQPPGKLSVRAAKLVSSRLWKYVSFGYRVIDRIILPFGFIAFTTGIITLARFFEGPEIFGGLAHWIKGGVFFWLGLFTLGRWAGSFGDLGWAWNVRPQRSRRHGEWHPTAEFVESFLIFFYGSTNIFLEHLGGWGQEWTAQDLEHLSITVLFIGGGLCGMLIESTRMRSLLNMTVTTSVSEHLSDEERAEREPPASYEFSLNPIPALVILLLGIMMGSHQQSTMISSMVHKQWGNLLTGASFARGLSYVIMWLKPPTSVLPSRPPTELLASFALIAGGIIFMASAADCVTGMIHYGLDAMFMYTVTMGMVGCLMAWELVVLAIKGWAVRQEQKKSRQH